MDEKAPQFNPAQFAQARPYLGTFAGVEKLDDHTAAFDTKVRDSLFPYEISYVLMVSPCRAKEVKYDWGQYALHPSGTGPYKFDKMVAHQRLEFVPNAAYWDKKRVPQATVHAVNGVSFAVRPGEVLCILGESGSGKSVTLRALLRLLPRQAKIEGSIRGDGEDVLALPMSGLRALRGGLVSMVFQEPMTALDPVYTVGQQIGETLRRHTGCSRQAAHARGLELLELVRIPSPERRLDAYPHELSGGLRQRAMIAMALSCNPRLLLADEPTTALDATVQVQVQVLILLRRLQRELGMGMICVTHALGFAAEIADTVAVMYAGRIVESGSVARVLAAPAHPYTAALLASTVHGQARERDIDAIPGSPPGMRRLLPGCSFAPRCARRIALCREAVPPTRFPAAAHMAACHVVDDA